MSPSRVLLVDDHPVVLQGVAKMLRGAADFGEVVQATTLDSAVEAARRLQPDIGVFDLRLGTALAPEVCSAVKRVAPACVMVVFTAYDDRTLLTACLEAGASGIILKDTHEFDLLSALRQARAGKMVLDPRVAGEQPDVLNGDTGAVYGPLTRREYEVLRLIAAGHGTREISQTLFLSTNTVRSYVQSLLSKLNATSRVQALATARQLRLI